MKNVFFSDLSSFSTQYLSFDNKALVTPKYLDKVHLQCPGQQLLREFIFSQRDRKEFRYDFQCKQPSNTVVTMTHTNDWTLWGHTLKSVKEGSLNFLDRQNIDCANNGYLKSFQIETDPENEVLRYVYECATIQGKVFSQASCSNRQTSKIQAAFFPTEIERERFDSASWSIIVLETQNVKCEENEALNSFHLLTDVNYVYYNYACCPVF